MERKNHNGRRINIEFDIKAPNADVTDAELEEWLRYRFHDIGALRCVNPLIDTYGTEPCFGSFRWRLI